MIRRSVIPPEPPVADFFEEQKRAEQARACRRRGEANPCLRARFCYDGSVGGRSGGMTDIPMVRLELCGLRFESSAANSAGVL